MSTRSAIARPNGSPGTFAGVYHHWDGYPEGLGATLYDLFNGHFKKNLPAMLTVLIDEHPAGWSTINNCDFSQLPGFNEYTPGREKRPDADRPHCFCHGDRNEEGNEITEKNASGCGCEYVYLLSLDRDSRPRMDILSSYCDPNGSHAGKKMIGMWGFGDPNGEWKPIGVVMLDEPEPDWSQIK